MSGTVSSVNVALARRLADRAPVEALGDEVGRYAGYGLFAGLAVIYVWFGGMKFTAYEAQGLTPLVENSPFLYWV